MPLRYPIVEEDRFLGPKIVFQAMQVIPPEFQSGGGGEGVKAGDPLTKLGTALNVSEGENDRKIAVTELQESASNVRLSTLQVKEIADGKVSLYLNNPFVVDDSLQYSNATLNASGATFLDAANRGGGALSSLAAGVTEGLNSIGDLFEQGAGSLAFRLALERAARTPAGAILPEGVRNAIGLAAKVTVNPNLRTTFQGVAIRQFSFQFKFLPVSREESVEVKNIVKFFRFHAYPETITLDGAVPLGYKYPDMFKIKLRSKVNGVFRNIGTPIKLSYLNSVQTVYNPTQQTFHADGSPTEVDMTLRFSEFKTLDRRDISFEEAESFYDITPHGSADQGPNDGYSGASGGFEGAR